MGLLIVGWPSGLLGIALAALIVLLLGLRVRRRSPWDIHDEESYKEHQGFSMQAVAPPVMLFLVLVTLMLGVGALDQGIPMYFAVIGDALGSLLFLFTLVWLLKLSR